MVRRTLVLCLSLVALAYVPGPLAAGFSAASPMAAAEPPAGATAAATPAAPEVTDPIPSRLLIARIGVDARVEARGLDADRNLPAPDRAEDVAWFSQGPQPGSRGNALVSGHVDAWTGPAVFARLSQLRAGDEVVVVNADASRLTFRVTGLRSLGATAHDASLFAPAETPRLTLITCSGRWDPLLKSYDQRLLVSATLV